MYTPTSAGGAAGPLSLGGGVGRDMALVEIV